MADAYGRQIDANGCFGTLSVNGEEFSHRGAGMDARGTEMDENQIGTVILELKSVESVRAAYCEAYFET